MPLTWKTVKGQTTLTWESPTMGAFWKIRPDMTDEEIAETLTNVVRTITGVTMDRDKRINELETELGIVPTTPATSPGTVVPSATGGTAPSAAPVPVPPAQPGKILMGPPSSVGDAPAGGPPPQGGVDFSALPTTTVPEHLQAAWEVVPPEQQSW